MKKRNLLVMFVAMLLALAMMPIISYAGTNVVEANGGEVTDGQSFVDALGGQATYTESDGIFTITLNGDISLAKDYIDIESGKYILNGSGTITRGEGYTGTLIKIESGTSLTLGGSVVVDGGAVWEKDGAPSTPAEGAENKGITATAPLINTNGTFRLTENAVVCNHCGPMDDDGAAVYSRGSVSIEGGTIRDCQTNYGSAIGIGDGPFSMSGGEICGCRGTWASCGGVIFIRNYNDNQRITGGRIHDNGGDIVIECFGILHVSGGTFENNDSCAFQSPYHEIYLSGGTFTNNKGAVRMWEYRACLSGEVEFTTETDTINGSVEVTGPLAATHPIHLRPHSYDLGYRAIYGDEDLVAANYNKFILTGSDDEELIINSSGLIDTDPTSLVTDGASFVTALGGEEYAESTYDEGSETYTVTLKKDTNRTRQLFISEGKYILNGSGTITRGEGYTGTLIKAESGTSLKLGGSVVIDGGAVWEKDGASSTPAEGAENKGITATAPLINTNGTFRLTENAVVCNHCGPMDDDGAAVYSRGSVSIEGGTIRDCQTNYGSAIGIGDGPFSMSGGEICGCRGTWASCGGVIFIRNYNDNQRITGGRIHDNGGDIVIECFGILHVSGGTFENNDSCAFQSPYHEIYLSGGTFTNNKGAVRMWEYRACLSGEVEFTTETDTINGSVEVTGPLAATHPIHLRPHSYDLGYRAIYGDEDLVAANYNKFILTGSDDEELIINSSGLIDTDPTSLVTDGASFVTALGGEEYAESTYDEGSETYTVTLKKDTNRTRQLFISEGKYILNGSGTITRGEGYTGTLIKAESGTSLTLGGSVVIDGGAVWEKDGASSTPAEGAENKGITATAPLINTNGTFRLTENAVVCNHCGPMDDDGAAVYSRGSVSIEGGTIRDCQTNYGSAIGIGDGPFSMSGGEICGCRGTWASCGGVIFIRNYNDNQRITGGRIHDNGGDIVIECFGILHVSGGTFENNDSCAFQSPYHEIYLSGGTFTNNKGAVRMWEYRACLSGEVEFTTETDTINGSVEVTGPLATTHPIHMRPHSYQTGTVVVNGTDSYSLTESDANLFKLTSDAPEGSLLNFNQAENKIIITYRTPVLVEAVPADNVVYDGDPVEEGIDFSVRVYLYPDGEKGDDITNRYTIGGGTIGVSYKYRKADSSGAYVIGLPSEAGSYTIVVSVNGDNTNYLAPGSGSLNLTINPRIFDFAVSDIEDVYYSGEAYTPEPQVSAEGIGLLAKDIDYEFSYENNTVPGEATVTANGIGNYEGSTGSTTFNILYIPILVEAEAVSEDGVMYDGQPIAEGEDFNVNIFTFLDETKGEDITSRYKAGGGSIDVSYQYKTADESEWTDGLPANVGAYKIRATAAKDDMNYCDSGTAEFEFLITKAYTVIWKNGDETLEEDENVPRNTSPSYDSEEPERAASAEYSYIFAGWATEDGLEEGVNAEALPAVSGDTVYYAAFSKTKNKYTVSFYDGIEGHDEPLKMEEVEYGSAAAAPEAPSREHYIFSGWDKDFINVTEDLTVTAQWKEIEKFTVIFVDGQGNTLKTEAVEEGKSATAPEDPTREGYTFDGWDKDFSNITEDLTVTAQWKEIEKYTVTFVDGQGNTLKTETVEKGKAATAPSDPTREGYTFDGWDKDFSNITEDLTVTAQWKKNASPPQPAQTFTVTFVDGQGNTMKTETVEEGKPATAPEDPIRKGFAFAGWDKDFSNITSDLTVTAKWKENAAPAPAEESRPNQMGYDGTAVGEGFSAAAAEKAITTMTSDDDLPGAVYSGLRLRSQKQTANSINLKWNKQSKAVQYVIYGNKCGKMNKPKKLATVKNNNTKTINNIAGKKLKKGTYYKFIVVALGKDNKVVSTSKLIHVTTKGGKYTNYKSVSVKKSVLTKAKKLKKGKTLKLNAKGVKQISKLGAKKHVAVRYESGNTKIALVTNKGVVKAKQKGTCYVYVFTQNGIFKKVKVVVK